MELSDEIGLGTDGSVVIAKDRIGGIERLEREVVNLLPVGVAGIFASNMLGPSEDLIAKSFGGCRLDLNLANVEAEPEVLGESILNGVVELQAAPVITLVGAANHDGVALVRRRLPHLTRATPAGMWVAREAITVYVDVRLANIG